jgi:quercetin dioxygenase-like cupin family protein
MNATHLVKKGTSDVLDALGPTVEILTLPADDAAYCVLKGTLPPGVSVPLHSHADPESFFVLSGAVQVLTERAGGFGWLEAREGDFIEIPGGAKHAFRNVTNQPVVQLVTTTSRLGRFFQEIGRPATRESLPPPSPDDLRRFVQVSAKYGYWLGSPEENAAVGIALPG